MALASHPRSSEVRRLVARNLLDARHRAGLSQSQLEALSGIPKARISRYENGHVVPSLASLDVLAAHLGLTLSEITRGV
jgi:transcriptional regulator with XRE-family HTH domain